MMTQTLIATIAFSIGLLAFCAGAWLTIWATSNNQVTEVAAAKLTGYFVTILALVSLIFTSYYIASGIMSAPTTGKSMKKGLYMKHTQKMKSSKASKNPNRS